MTTDFYFWHKSVWLCQNSITIVLLLLFYDSVKKKSYVGIIFVRLITNRPIDISYFWFFDNEKKYAYYAGHQI